MEFTKHLFAVMPVLIENHCKVRKCKLLILLATFHSMEAMAISFVMCHVNTLLIFIIRVLSKICNVIFIV
jgi:hypothetical protein